MIRGGGRRDFESDHDSIMSESQADYDTDAGPTGFASAPWKPEGPDKNGHAHVWGSDGDLVATVCDNPVYGESAHDRARLIAAAGTAAQEAREMGYDPQKAVEALPILLYVAERLRRESGAGDASPILCSIAGDAKEALASAEGSSDE